MAESHFLSFAAVTLLKPNLAEVIVSKGVEVNLTQVDEYHRFLLTHLNQPFGLLINRKYDYTYSFEAQLKIGNLPEVRAVAALVYNGTSAVSTLTLKNLPDRRNVNMEIFRDRDLALAWLDLQLQNEDKPV